MVTFEFAYYIPLLILYAATMVIFFKKRKTSFTLQVLCLLFFVYLVAVIGVTLLPIPIDKRLIASTIESGVADSRYNLIPFKSIKELAGHGYYLVGIRNIAGNILLLMPLGFFLPLIWSKINDIKMVAIAGFLSSLLIELMQLATSAWIGFFYKSFDVDDIILNAIGFILGYLCLRVPVTFTKTLPLNFENRLR